MTGWWNTIAVDRRQLLALAATAFLVRMFFVVVFPGGEYFTGLSSTYLHVIDNMLSGHGITVYVDVAPLHAPERMFVYEPFIDRPLGYLFLIFPFYALSGSVIAVQVLHALLAVVSVLLLRFLGSAWFSAGTGNRAAWLYAAWPLAARFEITVLPDAVMSFFLLGTLALLHKALKQPSPAKFAGAAGIVLGVGLLMRPDILFLPVFLLAAYWLSKRSFPPIRAIVVFAAGIVLVLGLHAVRNYEVTSGKIAPLGMGNGISMWEGISQFGDTLGTLYGDTRLAEFEGYPTWGYPDGIERDRARFSDAIDILRSHPLFYATLILRRTPVLLTPDWIMTRAFAPSLNEHLQGSPENTIQTYIAAYPLPSAIRGILILLQWSTLVLSFLALRWHRTHRDIWIPFLVIFYYIVIHLPTNTEARYLYPVIPFLLLLTSVAWTHLHERISGAGAREHHDPGL